MSHPTGESVQDVRDLVSRELFGRIDGCADAAKSLLDEMDDILRVLQVDRRDKRCGFVAAVLTICGTDVANAWAHLATLAGKDPQLDYQTANGRVTDA